MRAWLLAFRPKTLTAALVPVMVGSALAFSDFGNIDWLVVALTLVASFSIQIATNLFNDVIDFKKGADNASRLGPVRVTQSGLISGKRVAFFAGVFLLVAFACGIPLVLKGGAPIVVIGLLSLFLAYAYTGGPYPLAYKGAGDIFVILFFGVIAVGGVYYLHTMTLTWGALVAGLQVGLLANVLLVINNLRDMGEDKKANKLTLAVRFGERFARFEIIFLLGLAFLLSLYWLVYGEIFAGLMPLALLPPSLRLIKSILESSPGQVFNSYLAKAALIHMLFGFQLALGLVLL